MVREELHASGVRLRALLPGRLRWALRRLWLLHWYMLRNSHTSLILDSEPDCEMAMKLSEEMVISRLLEIEVGAPLNAKRLSDFFDEAEETLLSALTAMEARGIVRSEEAIACRWCDTLNYEPFEHSVEEEDDMPSMAQEPCCTACSRRLVLTNAQKIFRRP